MKMTSELKKKLFEKYDPNVFPTQRVLPVHLHVALHDIHSLNEKTHTLTSHLSVYLSWKDEGLVWTPADHSNITYFKQDIKKIWTPDIVVFQDIRELVRDLSSFKAKVLHNGTVSRMYHLILKSICRVNVKYFPFDQQICVLRFGSWTYDSSRLTLFPVKDLKSWQAQHGTSSQWVVQAMPVRRVEIKYRCCQTAFHHLSFFVVMRRLPVSHLYHLVLPCFVMKVTTVLGFLLPPSSGEKIALGVTTVLSLTVFLLLVAEQVSPEADVVPLSAQYFAVTVVLLCLSTTMTVVVLHIHHKSEKLQRMPQTLRKVVFEKFSHLVFMSTAVLTMRAEVRRLRRCHEQASALLDNMPVFKIQAPSRDVSLHEAMLDKHDLVSDPHAGHLDPNISSARRTSSDQKLSHAAHHFDDVHSQSAAAKSRLSDFVSENLMSALKSLLTKAYLFEHFQTKRERFQMIEAEWRLFAAIIDRFLFFVFLFTDIGLVLVFYTRGIDYSYDIDKLTNN